MISESVIQQPESKSLQPGDSVTVSCSHTGHCAAEHTIVMWLKNSQRSAPQIIYFSGNGTCQRKESGKTTCVYSLLLRDLSSDDAATYYCVVTSCGQTLVGNGTRIYIHNNVFESQLNPTIIALMLSNIALGIMTVILISTLCKSRRRDSTGITPCVVTRQLMDLQKIIKQTLGQKPELVSTFYRHNDKKGSSNDGLNKLSRFSLDTKEGTNNLKITHLQISDSATYFCVGSDLYSFKFGDGITVNVKGSGLNIPASVHQSASEIIQPGDSVSLNCTVHTGSCDGEHSVYWFKNSEDSPGLLYTRGGRNDQCERKPNTQTHTCVYNLPMESLNISHAGTYYCAVASCGHILFGDGTKLDFEDEVLSLALVYFLSGALAVTIILIVVLAISVYKMNQRNCQHS
ncbi:hypothetical protein F7725_004295, partial [Dissostichus mawsoni]